jgi:hypothetical protein
MRRLHPMGLPERGKWDQVLSGPWLVQRKQGPAGRPTKLGNCPWVREDSHDSDCRGRCCAGDCSGRYDRSFGEVVVGQAVLEGSPEPALIKRPHTEKKQ